MLVIAFLMGIVYSVPLGPLGQIMLNKAINKGFWHGFSMAIIGAIINFLYSFIFILGIGNLIRYRTLIFFIQPVGLLYLLYIGVREILISSVDHHKKNKKFNHPKVNVHQIKFGVKEFFSNLLTVSTYFISNPTMFAFWINFSAIINLKMIHDHNLTDYILFSLAFATGTLTCQYLAITIVKKSRKFINFSRIMHYVSSSLFFVMITYFIYLMVHNIRYFNGF